MNRTPYIAPEAMDEYMGSIKPIEPIVPEAPALPPAPADAPAEELQDEAQEGDQ